MINKKNCPHEVYIPLLTPEQRARTIECSICGTGLKLTDDIDIKQEEIVNEK